MKKIILTSIVLGAASLMQAQDTYLNDRLTNNSSDIYGSARYVGMGGAMGALGADISTISLNPAGVGLMRKSDASFTAGAIWDKDGISEESNAHATLDQAGFVYVMPTYGSALKNVNIAFNYQKKLNFNNAFYADNNNLNGYSQMDQLAELCNGGFGTNNNIAGFAADENYLTNIGEKVSNLYTGQLNRYTQRTWGSLNAYDINISGNVNDRGYWGVTFGFDNLRYRGWTDYYEESKLKAEASNLDKYGDYGLYNDIAIDGWGFNIKVGGIVRPIEDNALRIGLAVETPTWYQMKNSTYYQLYTTNSRTNSYESFLKYSIRTPWKARIALGSTVGNFLAWDVEYEYANYAQTKMGYPNENYDGYNRSLFSNTADKSMNQQTKDNLKAVHTIKAGIEYRPVSQFAIRLGYNYSTTGYKKNPTFDQYALDSYAMNYSTSTSYMKMKDVNIVTLGMGYKWKHAYLDVAYKLRAQKANFYAFYAYNENYPDMNQLPAVKDVDLTRHQITATLGFKF